MVTLMGLVHVSVTKFIQPPPSSYQLELKLQLLMVLVGMGIRVLLTELRGTQVWQCPRVWAEDFCTLVSMWSFIRISFFGV